MKAKKAIDRQVMEITTMNNEERFHSDLCFLQEMENRNFSHMYLCMFGISHKDV